MKTENTTAADATNVAAAPAAAAPAVPAPPTKMDKAKVLYAGLKDGSIALIEGKSARATFITQAQEADIGMTKAGAATYWQNLESAAKGGKLYPHTAAKKKDEAKPADAAPAETLKDQEHAEEVAAEGGEAKDPEDLSHLEG